MGVLKDTRWCEKRRIVAALQADIRTRVGSRIGHRLEGCRPSFFIDLVYLLVGPAWVMAKAYRQMGWRY